MAFLQTIIKKAGTLIGTRRTINFIEGTNVTLTIADDSVNDEVDITITAAGGSGSPGGLDTHVQFNDSGSFGGEAAFTYDKTTNALSLTGTENITHTAIETDDHALEIDIDAAGFGDVKAVDIVYKTGAIALGEDEGVILVNIDDTGSSGGDVFGYEILTTNFGSTQVIGMKVGVNVAPISHNSGAFGNMDSALNKAVNVLAALSSGGAGNISMFVADNDTVTIGDAAKFDEMEILIDTPASGNGIAPTFEYSTGVGTWAVFTPTDGTNGFKNTGVILWDLTDLSGWVVGTGSEYLIRITRTRNTLLTTPIVDTIQITLSVVYSWNKDGDIVIKSVTPSNLTASEIVITDANKKLVSAAVTTYPSLTELSYVKGVTSAIQTQLNGKLATPTGTPDGTKFLRDDNTWQAVSGGSGLTQQQVEGII